MLETTFYFKNAVEIFVGPQTSFPFLGYDFIDFFRLLENKLNQPSFKMLAINLIAGFENKYETEPYKTLIKEYYPGIDKNYIKAVSFSALILSKFDQKFIDSLNEGGKIMYRYLIDANYDDIDINNARKHCEDLTGEDFTIAIDLKNFFSDLSRRKKKDTVLKEAYENFNSFFSARTPPSDTFTFIFLPAILNLGNPNGLSIIMASLSNAPDDIKYLVIEMLDLFYNDPTYKTELSGWVMFLEAWNRSIIKE
jgi:hypothetical protein